MEILKSKGTLKLIKISDTLYEIRDNDEIVLKMEGSYTEKQLTEQFDNVGENYIIV